MIDKDIQKALEESRQRILETLKQEQEIDRRALPLILCSRNELICQLLETLPKNESAFNKGLQMRNDNFSKDQIIRKQAKLEYMKEYESKKVVKKE